MTHTEAAITAKLDAAQKEITRLRAELDRVTGERNALLRQVDDLAGDVIAEALKEIATPQPPAPAPFVHRHGMVGERPAPAEAAPEGPKCKICRDGNLHPMSVYDRCPVCGTGRAQ